LLQHDYQSSGDPRLLFPDYPVSCFTNDKPNKARLRIAQYALKPYSWDSKTSVGRGPATRVVIHGFDPLMVTETKIRVMLSQFGDVSEVNNLTDPKTGSFLGVCTVQFRDKSRDGRLIKAMEAARRAEKEGNGQRIDQWQVKIERDAEGVRSKRYADKIIKARHHSQAKLVQSVKPTISLSTESRIEPIAPPPNAPKGPSGKPSVALLKPPPVVAKPAPAPRPAAHALVENDPVVTSLKRKPYIFIAHCYVPVLGTTIKHLQNRMRMYDWREVRCDKLGYYLVFDDSKRGEDECLKCFRGSHLQPLFTYTMNMECQQYGNPNYERSPTPERVAAEQLERDEQRKLIEEDELDYENEKKIRAENLDLAKAALEKLFPELTSMILSDIKAGIVKPKVFDLLHPDRHVDRRKRLGLPDPSNPDMQRPPAFAISRVDETYSGGYRKSFNRFDRKPRQEVRTGGNAFTDDRRRRRPQRPAQSLHRRLIDFIDSDESDDERRTSITRISDGPDSRAISEARQSPAFIDDDGYLTPKTKRPRLDNTWGVDSDQESLDAPLVVSRKTKSIDKDPDDMTMAELKKLVSSSTLSKNTKLYKRAAAELKRRKEAEMLGVQKEETDPDSVTATPEPEVKGKKKPTLKGVAKKKTKKQLLAEAEEAAMSATPETGAELEEPVPETPIEQPLETGPLEFKMGMSTPFPKRIVEDDESLVLDLDGWQELIKNDEDLRLLKEALAGIQAEDLRVDANAYAWTEKQIKQINGSRPGATTSQVKIEGYYVPNDTGSARTEGYRKIKQDEKGLYLPHRIKVKQQREKLQDEARRNKSMNGVLGDVANPMAFKAATAGLSSNVTSRGFRADARRIHNEIAQISAAHQSHFGTGDSQDLAVRFNQLKKRKKLVRFDRSSIHGWGLYTQENINANDMIIEYVGEKVRQRVADCREVMYDKQGVGSSYLFRIDDDMVIDATKKGGIARFINHSCVPNCTAKIIKVGVTKRIVIYALRDISKGMFVLSLSLLF
jgi:histone-lysine N-methyltransferase SETD1